MRKNTMLLLLLLLLFRKRKKSLRSRVLVMHNAIGFRIENQSFNLCSSNWNTVPLDRRRPTIYIWKFFRLLHTIKRRLSNLPNS